MGSKKIVTFKNVIAAPETTNELQQHIKIITTTPSTRMQIAKQTAMWTGMTAMQIGRMAIQQEIGKTSTKIGISAI